jgi:hypothetical protein
VKIKEEKENYEENELQSSMQKRKKRQKVCNESKFLAHLRKSSNYIFRRGGGNIWYQTKLYYRNL